MGAAGWEKEAILLRLRRRERLFRVKVAAMILFGVPLSFVGPFVLATVFWFAGHAAGYCSWSRVWVHWSWLFLALVIVVVPLLYRLEIRTTGGYLTEAMQDTKPHRPMGAAFLPGPAAQVGALVAVAANPRAVSAGVVEVFLFGPRLVVGAFIQFRAARHLKQAEVGRAASILAVLLGRDQGVETSRLLRRDEQLEDLLPTLAYLVFHRWVGVRSGWQQVYLYSMSREALRGVESESPPR